MKVDQIQDPIAAQRVKRLLQLLKQVNDRLDRNVPAIVDVDHLRSLPPGTFGHAWIQHLDENNLEPFDYGPRRQQLHDGVHVLTGYGTDPLGEAEVQAFLLGAKFQIAHLILLTGLLKGIQRQQRHNRYSQDWSDIRSRLIRAYRRGKVSRFDPDAWYPETQWERSLTAVQTWYHVPLNP